LADLDALEVAEQHLMGIVDLFRHSPNLLVDKGNHLG